MSYHPQYTISSRLLERVGQISAAREIIENSPLIPAWERRFRQEARNRIIHHGTHLEGNNLNLDEVEALLAGDKSSDQVIARERDVQEVINYREVMDYIDSLDRTEEDIKANGGMVPLTQEELKHIHALTVKRLLPENESGVYRNVKVVIRNTTTGEITFRPPSPLEVPLAMQDLFNWLTSSEGTSTHPLLRAGILHYEIVRIHPFTDGNGRAARAMALLLLFLEGFKVKKFFSLEDYYDSHPAEYYDALKSVESSSGDLTKWLEYFVEGIAIEFNRVKVLVQKLSLDLKLKNTFGGKQIALSDRQIKLVEYIERHGSLTMSEGRELFPDISDDTVLRDLRDLVKKKLLNRRGNTKGAKYFLAKN